MSVRRREPTRSCDGRGHADGQASVATGYSGNTEFMNEENSLLVDTSL